MNDLRTAALQALEALDVSLQMMLPKQQSDQARRAAHALRAALAEPVQEPVLVVEREPDYWSGGHFHEGSRPHIDPTKVWGLLIGTKLYTAPPQRKPLAEWQITDLMADIDPEDMCSWTFRQGVYAAEKHHGIKP
jgi:hypothetical protein